MVDTQRFNLGPGCVKAVTDVANALTDRHGKTSVLAVASYLPLDIDSVARVMDALQEMDHTEVEIGEDDVTYYVVDDAEEPVDLNSDLYIEGNQAFLKNLETLRRDEDWIRKVRNHHEILRAASKAKSRHVSLDYLVEETGLPKPRLQSILNDFASQGIVHFDLEETDNTVRFTFPNFGYPSKRYGRHLEVMDDLESKETGRLAWIALATGGAIILAIVILSKLL